MQLDAILEVAIGLVTTWLILSIAVSQIQEFIVERIKWRSRFLERRLMDMLQNRDLVNQFYQHPFIQALYTKSMTGVPQKPNSVPDDVFGKVMVDVFLNPGKTGQEIPASTMSTSQMTQKVNESMAWLEEEDPPLARTMKHLVPKMDGPITESEPIKLENNLAVFRNNAEGWFSTTMSQATNTYRKNAQALALLLGFALAWLLNVDSVFITNQLWRDPTLRQTIVAQAGSVNPAVDVSFDTTTAKLKQLSLPVGWHTDALPQNSWGWAIKCFGLFITALATAQGSPFWFDVLGRISNIRKERARNS
jgi:hypothetical protein